MKEILYLIAPLLLFTAKVPQIIKIWKTKKTEGISKANYIMTGSGLTIMLIQAIDVGAVKPRLLFCNFTQHRIAHNFSSLLE